MRGSIPQSRLAVLACSAALSARRRLGASTIGCRGFKLAAAVLLLVLWVADFLIGDSYYLSHPWPTIAAAWAIIFVEEEHLPMNPLSLVVIVFAPFELDYMMFAIDQAEVIHLLIVRVLIVGGLSGLAVGALACRVDPEVVSSDRWMIESFSETLMAGAVGALVAGCLAFAVATPAVMATEGERCIEGASSGVATQVQAIDLIWV